MARLKNQAVLYRLAYTDNAEIAPLFLQPAGACRPPNWSTSGMRELLGQRRVVLTARGKGVP